MGGLRAGGGAGSSDRVTSISGNLTGRLSARAPPRDRDHLVVTTLVAHFGEVEHCPPAAVEQHGVPPRASATSGRGIAGVTTTSHAHRLDRDRRHRCAVPAVPPLDDDFATVRARTIQRAVDMTVEARPSRAVNAAAHLERRNAANVGIRSDSS